MGVKNYLLKNSSRTLGVVVSTGADRTCSVIIERPFIHPRTRRTVMYQTKFLCHDRHEICGVGDVVHIVEVEQKISKKKYHIVVDMVKRFPQLEGEPFPMSLLSSPPTEEEIEAGRKISREISYIRDGPSVPEVDRLHALAQQAVNKGGAYTTFVWNDSTIARSNDSIEKSVGSSTSADTKDTMLQ